MTRQFCDRCGFDVTDKMSAAVSIVGDADAQGNGSVSESVDLCSSCAKALGAWLRPPTAKAKTKR
jgi:hypothetical protein